MLVKCVCSHCGHSYLSDNELAEIACPRCAVPDEDAVRVSSGPSRPAGAGLGLGEETAEQENLEEIPLRFEAKAPPPMFVTGERLLRGILFGSLAAGLLGATLGGALSATALELPALPAVLIALVGAAACRYGFGGRAASRSRGRAMTAGALAALVGMAGFMGGTWAVDRVKGARAGQAQAEINSGLKALVTRYRDTRDAGVAIVLKQRIEEARRLSSLSAAQIEDYLWIQQAHINQPLLAHAKLRLTHSPVVRLGPNGRSIRVKRTATLALRLGEILLALIVAIRVVAPKG